jgi:hypothetical protein
MTVLYWGLYKTLEILISQHVLPRSFLIVYLSTSAITKNRLGRLVGYLGVFGLNRFKSQNKGLVNFLGFSEYMQDYFQKIYACRWNACGAQIQQTLSGQIVIANELETLLNC